MDRRFALILNRGRAAYLIKHFESLNNLLDFFLNDFNKRLFYLKKTD